MYFKTLISNCCILAFLFGCAKQNTPQGEPVHVQLKASGDCLSNLDGKFKNYTEGKSSPNDVRAFWTCMKASIQQFKDITSGDSGGDVYSPESLRHFIEHYFYTTKHIPDNVMTGLMQMKRVLLAGSEKNVTKEELARLNSLFDELSAVMVEMQPHIRTLLRKDKGAPEAEVRAAGVSLQKGLARLGAWLATQNQTLTYQQITQAVNSIAQWLQEDGKDSSGMHTLRQAVLVLPEAKSILIGGDKSGVVGADWRPLTTALGQGLYLYLAVANGYDANLDAALIRETVPESATQTIDALMASAQRHPENQITMQEFKNLFAKLDQTDWLPSSIKSPGLNAAVQWFFNRILGGGTAEVAGLNLNGLAKLRQLTSDWQTLYMQPASSTLPLMQEFNHILAASPPMDWDEQGRMQFPSVMPTAWSLYARRHLAWPFAVLKLVKQAYVGNSPTLTPDQITVVAGEVLPLLQNFGWMKSTKTSIGRRILREADLFTLASNGDLLLDLNEASRYLAFVVGGYRSAQVWMEAVKPACPNAEADCLRAQGQAQRAQVFANMPRLQAVLGTWPSAKFVKYMMNAETTILGAPEAAKFTAGDLLQTYQLFAYVEVFLELYDNQPRDEMVEYAEAVEAYSVYGRELGSLLPGSDVGFFSYMIKYGDTPFTSYGGQIEYNKWVWHPEARVMAADRSMLMGILSQLAKYASQ